METALLAAAALAALASQAHAQDSHAGPAAHGGQHSPTSDGGGPADPHAGHDMPAAADAPVEYPLGALPPPMASALGPFPMSRDGSGTAWVPDASPHMEAGR